MSTLEERLASLERTNRRWRFVAAGLALLLLVALVGAAANDRSPSDVLKARRLEILAPNGQPAIILGAESDYTLLRLQSPDRKRGIALVADPDAASLALLKNKETPLFSAKAEDEGASLWLWDGRQPSQHPAAVVLSSFYSQKRHAGAASLDLTRGTRESNVGASLSLHDPDTGASLLLTRPLGKTTVFKLDESGDLRAQPPTPGR